jgi:exonuclease VII large subunit
LRMIVAQSAPIVNAIGHESGVELVNRIALFNPKQRYRLPNLVGLYI